MRMWNQARPAEQNAPNAILERMRRRIGRLGLLVAIVSTLLTAGVIFVVYACVHMG